VEILISLTWRETTSEQPTGEQSAAKTLPSKRPRKNPMTRSSDFLWG
jgi:hypothetical protein